MASVKDILDRKGAQVVTVTPETTVLEAARLMNRHKIGGLVVVDEKGGVAGVFTERDILQRVIAEDRSPREVPVSQVMTAKVACCKLNTTLEECQSVMTSQRIRHLPVVEDGRLLGIVTSGDILAMEREVQQTTIEYLHDFLHGRR